MRKKVVRFIQEQNLFTHDATVVVACSGGADSTALLDILANLPGLHLNLVAAHLNHMLRGDESDGDERFVSSSVGRYGIQLEISRVDVAGLAQEKRLSLEEAGREARYDFLRAVARKYAASAIALGHHRDDQAETVLMRLVRGAGGSGLSGMRPESGGLIRPLLHVSRTEIEAYLRSAGLTWMEDRSNSDTRFLRNRIRHELLPILETFNPEMVKALSQSAEALAADEELLNGLTAEAFSRTAESGGASVRFDLKKLFLEPAHVRKRLYRSAVCSVQGSLKRISFIHLSAIDGVASSQKPGGVLNLPCGVKVVREYASLIFTGTSEISLPEGYELLIAGCEAYSLPCGGRISVSPAEGSEPLGKHSIIVDLDEVPFPWTVRYFRNGDRFRPLGLNGTKKLKDLFIDRKIPLRERSRIPLLVVRDEIIWVCGVQPSERTRIIAGSQREHQLRVEYTAASIRH